MSLSARLRSGAAAVRAELVDAVFPRRCLVCGAGAADGLACGDHRLPGGLEGPRCRRCAARLAPVLPDGATCAECRRRPPGFARVVALVDYRGDSVRDWLLALKYGGRRDLAEPLGRLLGALLAEERATAAGAALLVPVPLHPWRRFERGYDQALLLARAAGERAGVPVARALARTRATAVQGGAGAVSREANVRGAFGERRGWLGRGRRDAARLAGKAVWLVDDVVTSGATASECARALRRLGAASVSVLCVARAPGGKDAG